MQSWGDGLLGLCLRRTSQEEGEEESWPEEPQAGREVHRLEAEQPVCRGQGGRGWLQVKSDQGRGGSGPCDDLAFTNRRGLWQTRV